mmetsp:Transcript_27815/g.54536  ORF Transcript_27815/g.54536 Transcript_27815/m.54536 type:complete len:391 (+) Transcript_27815:1109-2281(+)
MARERVGTCEGLHVLPQLRDLRVVREALQEFLQGLAVLLLDGAADLDGPVEEFGDLLKLLLLQPASCHGRGPHSHSSGCHRRGIPKDGVLVQSDVAGVAHLLHLGSRDALRPQVPQNQVVVGAVGHQLVPLAHQVVTTRLGVLHDLLGVCVELGSGHLLQLCGEASDLMIVGSSLKRGEDGEVDLVLHVGDSLLVEEDHATSGTTERLVRGRCHHVSIGERRWVGLAGDQARDMRHVDEEESADLVAHLAELGPVDRAGVGRGTRDDHGRSEELGAFPEGVEVQPPRLGVHLVGQRLEVDRGRADLLLCRVVSVCQMAAARQVHPHDACMRRKQSRIGSEVGRAARVRLDVHAPLLRIQSEGCQRSPLAKYLHLVNDLISSVIPRAGVSF